MAKALRERGGKEYKGTQRTRKAVHGECAVELAKWKCPIISLSREPYEAKLCAAGRGVESLTQSGEVRREASGSSTYLRAKTGGNKSMSEKRETLEGVYGAVPQDPRDMVKAGLPEPQ